MAAGDDAFEEEILAEWYREKSKDSSMLLAKG